MLHRGPEESSYGPDMGHICPITFSSNFQKNSSVRGLFKKMKFFYTHVSPNFCARRSIMMIMVCSGSVVVTTHDSESGCLGSNPEWGLIYYEASITAQGLPEPSSLLGSTLGTRAAEHKGCNWGMQVDWWLQPCAAGICHRNKVNSTAWLYRKAQPKDSIIYIHTYIHTWFQTY